MAEVRAPYSSRSPYHGWLPEYPEVHLAFLHEHFVRSHPNHRGPNDEPIEDLPYVTQFINAIKDLPGDYEKMIFEQVKPYADWVNRSIEDDEMKIDFHFKTIDDVQRALNSALRSPPKVLIARREDGTLVGEPIGIPIYLILDLLCNTRAAYDLFRIPQVNDAAKALLKGWGDAHLDAPGSNSTLNTSDEGWFGKYGFSKLVSGLQGQSFWDAFGVKDPEHAREKWKTWNEFFTRSFADMDKDRPVETFVHPREGVIPIRNACESTTVRTVHGIKTHDTFWLKGQRYSLYDMFGGSEEDAARFEGGSAYQAFLSPSDYHHWHSPISGTVVTAKVIPGNYYALLPDEGAPADDPDYAPGDPHGSLIRCQPFLSMTAARAVFIIQPTAQELEWVAMISVGMVEVSTNEIAKKFEKIDSKDPSTYVSVECGERLGNFRFGGSTHVVVLKLRNSKTHKIVFKDRYDIDIVPNQHRWIRSIIGRVEPK